MGRPHLVLLLGHVGRGFLPRIARIGHIAQLPYYPRVILQDGLYQHEGWLPLVFGNDERSIHGNYAVYYVLSMEGEVKTFITIKALVDPVSLEFPSVTPKVKAAVWGERELFDMYGLKAVGLPDQRRLVLPDDWPDDLYPLRKDSMDYRLRPDPTTATETYEFINEKGEARIVTYHF